MDLSTLSRQLNMSVHELRDQMKQAGFRISDRARKVDNNLAREIMRKLSGKTQEPVVPQKAAVAEIKIPAFLSVKDFADLLKLPVTVVIKKLIENGVMATINEEIDADTATIVASEFGVDAQVQKPEGDLVKLGMSYATEVIAGGDPAALQTRPPIVAVMGHVDHGKTTLLDTIRKTNVVATEAGAITQHIGAYQVEVPQEPQIRDGGEAELGIQHPSKITILDTPGHEAFAAMRARGANVTDIIVLVVAADDSVKPQTVEVINRAKLTRTPLVVAINKMDKPGANPDKVKADLAALGVTVEEWGGNVPAVPISAKTGEGIDKLLEILLLTAEMEELKANPEGKTVGAVIESHLSRGKGPVATVLIQNGTLKIGDPVVVGSSFGKIRSMEDAVGKRVKVARPGDPVQISGLDIVPAVGDILRVSESLEEAKQHALRSQHADRAKRLQSRMQIKADPATSELRLIIRADVQGSLEAIMNAFSTLGSEDVKINIVDQGVGEVSDSDVQLAENTKSTIIGFHARISPQAAKLAKQKGITVDSYDIIYELIEEVTEALLQMMPMDIIQTQIGRAKIKAIFRTEKNQMIVGGEVIEGKMVDKKKFKLYRDKELVGEGKIEELQQNKVEVAEVGVGKEFGIKASVTTTVGAGDIVEVYDETVQRRGHDHAPRQS